MELFPVLLRDVSLECLSRVTYEYFPYLTSVCKGWKGELNKPEFLAFRKMTGHCQMLMVEAKEQLTLFELKTGKCFKLPDSEWVTKYDRVTCVRTGTELVVMGGEHMVHNLSASYSIHIYNFMSGVWRRGVDMPGEQRISFGCGSDNNRWIYVVGGKGVNGGEMKSAMAYDLKEDKWIDLPDMSCPRTNSKVISQHGKVHVIGGDYPVETILEIFDLSIWQWGDPKEVAEENLLSFTCVYGDDGNIYKFNDRYLKTRKEDKWHTVAELPSNMDIFTLKAWEGKLIVMDWTPQKPQVVYRKSSEEEPPVASGWSYWCEGILYNFSNSKYQNAYIIDLKMYQWTQLNLPANFWSCDCFEI